MKIDCRVGDSVINKTLEIIHKIFEKEKVQLNINKMFESIKKDAGLLSRIYKVPMYLRKTCFPYWFFC